MAEKANLQLDIDQMAMKRWLSLRKTTKSKPHSTFDTNKAYLCCKQFLKQNSKGLFLGEINIERLEANMRALKVLIEIISQQGQHEKTILYSSQLLSWSVIYRQEKTVQTQPSENPLKLLESFLWFTSGYAHLQLGHVGKAIEDLRNAEQFCKEDNSLLIKIYYAQMMTCLMNSEARSTMSYLTKLLLIFYKGYLLNTTMNCDDSPTSTQASDLANLPDEFWKCFISSFSSLPLLELAESAKKQYNLPIAKILLEHFISCHSTTFSLKSEVNYARSKLKEIQRINQVMNDTATF